MIISFAPFARAAFGINRPPLGASWAPGPVARLQYPDSRKEKARLPREEEGQPRSVPVFGGGSVHRLRRARHSEGGERSAAPLTNAREEEGVRIRVGPDLRKGPGMVARLLREEEEQPRSLRSTEGGGPATVVFGRDAPREERGASRQNERQGGGRRPRLCGARPLERPRNSGRGSQGGGGEPRRSAVGPGRRRGLSYWSEPRRREEEAAGSLHDRPREEEGPSFWSQALAGPEIQASLP